MKQEFVELDSVMNLAEAMGNMDGDAELLQEIVGIFMQTGAEQLTLLKGAVAAGDARDVALRAHGMKGGASNFCARKFVAAALKLELLAKSGTLDGAPGLLAAMKESFTELEEITPLVNWAEVEQNWSR